MIYFFFFTSVLYKDAVGYFITCGKFFHALYVHGAEIPADFCADAGKNNYWS